jgi:hypothetical protein
VIDSLTFEDREFMHGYKKHPRIAVDTIWGLQFVSIIDDNVRRRMWAVCCSISGGICVAGISPAMAATKGPRATPAAGARHPREAAALGVLVPSELHASVGALIDLSSLRVNQSLLYVSERRSKMIS